MSPCGVSPAVCALRWKDTPRRTSNLQVRFKHTRLRQSHGRSSEEVQRPDCPATPRHPPPSAFAVVMSAESDREREAVAEKQEYVPIVFGNTSFEVVESYDNWVADIYDEATPKYFYNGPSIAAEATAGVVPEETRATLRVLDVAAGTGQVGQHLHRLGFKLLDAVEPSQGMLRRLKETKLYSNTFQEFVGLGQPTKVPADTYDVVVMCGGFAKGHIPVEGVDDMIRAAKPGGLVVLAINRMSTENLEPYRDHLVPLMDRRETEGRWTKVSQKSVPQFFRGREGIVYIYRML